LLRSISGDSFFEDYLTFQFSDSVRDFLIALPKIPYRAVYLLSIFKLKLHLFVRLLQLRDIILGQLELML